MRQYILRDLFTNSSLGASCALSVAGSRAPAMHASQPRGPVKWIHCSGSAGASVVAHSVALPLIEIAFSTLDCSAVPTCGAWCSATAAKRGPLKQSWAEIQHSRDDEPLGVLMQMRNVRVNGFFFFSSLRVLPGVLVDTLLLCSGNFASNVCLLCYINPISSFKRNTTDWTLDQAWGLIKSSYYFVTNVGSKCVNRHPFVV